MKTADHTNPVVSRALEKYRASEYAISVTDFFSPGEKLEIYKELCSLPGNGNTRCFFWGGCRGAERCAAVFLPEWYMPEGVPQHRMPGDTERTEAFSSLLAGNSEISAEIPIKKIKISGSGFKKLTHRDYMGSILSLGIDRSVIGDIAVVSDSEAVVFVAERISGFIVSELTKIGRDGVVCISSEADPVWEIPRRYEDFSLVVSSPRIDGIVKSITGLSREKSADLVRAGLVELSYTATDNVSAGVSEGDIVSIRGYGKYLIGSVSGETKSGRLRISCKKYL